MTIGPGSRIGPYEVTALIGEGGMGKVWRAHHAALKRDVALKVLPDFFAADAERLARFSREAQVLAALNHPNIAHLYGLEEVDGVKALVMELVEGPTLADLIGPGESGTAAARALPFDEALSIARQIADALATAHEQGVIHRDLKPANVKVRPDGVVKVLDFGLATYWAPAGASGAGRAGGPGGAGWDLTNSPTITSPAMTQAGMILGTAAYMAPEQARGKPIDKRADIWAFGAVLFEMLTGRRAFEGEDVTVTLARVVEREPTFEAIAPSVPSHVRHIVQLCLRKDPNRRVSDIRDVRLALEGEFATAPAISGPPGPPRHTAPRWRQPLLLVLAAAAGAGLVAAGLALIRAPAEPLGVVRMVHPLPEGRTFRSLGRRIAALSPDGRHFAYNSNDGLYLRSMDSLVERRIAGTEDVTLISQTFSPDGQLLAYWVSGELKKVSVAGGAPTRLATIVNSPFGLSWESDGTILFDQNEGVWQVSENGGEPRQLFATDGRPMQPQKLPGTDWVLYTLWPRTGEDPQIVVQTSGSGERRVLQSNADSARYLPTGHLVFASDGVLYARPFNADRLEPTGGPVPVVEGVRRTVGTNSLVDFDVSRSGSLVYVAGPAKTSGTLSTIAVTDRLGSPVPVGIPPGPYEHVRVSHDGSRLAVGSNDRLEANVSIYDVGGKSALRRLTFGGRNRFPMWSPDGQRVAFQSTREGDEAIFIQAADGTGLTRLTKPGPEEVHIPEDWAPDGKHILFAVLKGSEYSLWSVSPDGGTPTRFGDVRSAEPIGSVFSADGKWIAYHTIETLGLWQSPDAGVFVEPFPATGVRYQAPRVNRDFQPFWSRDGGTLFYVGSTGSRQLVAVPVSRASGLTFGTPETLPFTLTAGRLSGATRAFDVMPDGRFIGLLPGDGLDPLADRSPEVHVIVNWSEEVKRLAPTK